MTTHLIEVLYTLTHPGDGGLADTRTAYVEVLAATPTEATLIAAQMVAGRIRDAVTGRGMVVGTALVE